MGNERMYTLNEKQKNIQQDKKENEKNGELHRMPTQAFFKVMNVAEALTSE